LDFAGTGFVLVDEEEEVREAGEERKTTRRKKSGARKRRHGGNVRAGRGFSSTSIASPSSAIISYIHNAAKDQT